MTATPLTKAAGDRDEETAIDTAKFPTPRIPLDLPHALAACPRQAYVQCRDWLDTLRYYCQNPQFRRADLACLRAYWTRDPYRICVRRLAPLGREQAPAVYGETSFSTLEAVARAVGLSKRDVLYELGCGRGRAVCWFHAFYRCRVVGVDIVPDFIVEARRIARAAQMRNVEFLLADLFEVDCRDATVIYLYGTAFSVDAIRELARRLKTLKPGTRIVSVSYPLTAYSDGPEFVLEKIIPVEFVWGATNVYIQRRA